MQKFCVNLVPGPALPVRHLTENLDTFQVLAYTYTSVSETIRKLPLIKAQTAFKNQKNKLWRKTIFNMADGIITPWNVTRSRH